MPNELSKPVFASASGKKVFAKTSPVTMLYRKKSYHSIEVPIVLATTARTSIERRWLSLSSPLTAVLIFFSFVTLRQETGIRLVLGRILPGANKTLHTEKG